MGRGEKKNTNSLGGEGGEGGVTGRFNISETGRSVERASTAHTEKKVRMNLPWSGTSNHLLLVRSKGSERERRRGRGIKLLDEVALGRPLRDREIPFAMRLLRCKKKNTLLDATGKKG